MGRAPQSKRAVRGPPVQGDCITRSGAESVEDGAEVGVIERGAEAFGSDAGTA